MKKFLSKICLIPVILASFAIGVFADNNMQEIKAYMNKGLSIVFQGNVKSMYDGNNQKVYPITYNGTIYLPIKSIGQMTGLAVSYDNASKTLYIGNKSVGAKDFIETVQPYEGNCHYTIKDREQRSIAGKTVDHYIRPISKLYYDLGGKYNKISFKSYSEKDGSLYFYGDGELLGKYDITANELPNKTYTVDVKGVQQFVITTNYSWIYMFDTVIE
ncbi:hypothetical protein HMPREF9628_01373 [Peptoanaerobacter stomatis]|uniref:Copper amine oxidase-like N-terminal domain-containing protein n=1 Tax=Peptoanaerobacter stomatis TaxID=796937 RepID=G9XBK6_9FIRM|nr:hypothetical protein [Peptoanaerobacter stomatis]EHL19684.1 hypothetical protein HMPREF9628_01373 [Peptoanaerobacter stomatis]